MIREFSFLHDKESGQTVAHGSVKSGSAVPWFPQVDVAFSRGHRMAAPRCGDHVRAARRGRSVAASSVSLHQENKNLAEYSPPHSGGSLLLSH